MWGLPWAQSFAALLAHCLLGVPATCCYCSHGALILLFQAGWDLLRFPSIPSGGPFSCPRTLLQAMPEKEPWPAGPSVAPETHAGSCDSMTGSTSTHSGSVCTWLALLHPALPRATPPLLTALALSSIFLSDCESALGDRESRLGQFSEWEDHHGLD